MDIKNMYGTINKVSIKKDNGEIEKIKGLILPSYEHKTNGDIIKELKGYITIVDLSLNRYNIDINNIVEVKRTTVDKRYKKIYEEVYGNFKDQLKIYKKKKSNNKADVSEELIKEYLKNHLSINIKEKDIGFNGKNITIELKLDNDIISSDSYEIQQDQG